jgi:hypothetical protein
MESRQVILVAGDFGDRLEESFADKAFTLLCQRQDPNLNNGHNHLVLEKVHVPPDINGVETVRAEVLGKVREYDVLACICAAGSLRSDILVKAVREIHLPVLLTVATEVSLVKGSPNVLRLVPNNRIQAQAIVQYAMFFKDKQLEAGVGSDELKVDLLCDDANQNGLEHSYEKDLVSELKGACDQEFGLGDCQNYNTPQGKLLIAIVTPNKAKDAISGHGAYYSHILFPDNIEESHIKEAIESPDHVVMPTILLADLFYDYAHYAVKAMNGVKEIATKFTNEAESRPELSKRLQTRLDQLVSALEKVGGCRFSDREEIGHGYKIRKVDFRTEGNKR